FFFQAEDGIRDFHVTGVQTCALPICSVDINILPAALIERIETVTGGASAAYGTDAVAGAVNFILDTDYTGWEASVQAGATGEGDRDNKQYSVTWGSPIGARLHLLLSGEYY